MNSSAPPQLNPIPYRRTILTKFLCELLIWSWWQLSNFKLSEHKLYTNFIPAPVTSEDNILINSPSSGQIYVSFFVVFLPIHNGEIVLRLFFLFYSLIQNSICISCGYCVISDDGICCCLMMSKYTALYVMSDDGRHINSGIRQGRVYIMGFSSLTFPLLPDWNDWLHQHRRDYQLTTSSRLEKNMLLRCLSTCHC